MFELTTPAFLVDAAVVLRNCERMRAKALQSGVAFRPHVKTHKTAEIARMQHGGSTGPITVSTMAEVEFFAAAGFRDITYAVPVAPGKLPRVASLAREIERLNIVIDSERALAALEEYHRAHGTVFDVFLKIDCGYHRAGVAPDDPDSERLAFAISRSPAVHFQGLLTHAGHAYDARDAEGIRRIAAEETSSLSRFRALLGLEELTRSVGSTPTAAVVERFDDCDEVRPGNYVFFDAFQAAIGACELRDVAVSVLAAVIGCYPERGTLLIDAGALALSKDPGARHLGTPPGFGLVCDAALQPLPLRLTTLSQEHGKVEGEGAAIAAHPVGSQLRVIPNHSCLTAAMFDAYHVVEGGAVTAAWRPVRGW
jgi:D-serine deaminase-like pyridoxal phosphate-dependent protein